MEYVEDFEEYEDESSDDGGDQMDRILVPKLPVADFDDYDPTQPPITGEEYLRRVQLEAQKCEEVVVAKNLDLSKLRHNQDFTVEISNGFIKADPEVIPSLDWQREQVSEFTKVRLKMSRMKDFRVKCGLTDVRPFFRNKPMSWWKQFCTGRKDNDTSDSSTGSESESDLSTPTGTPNQKSSVKREKRPKPEPNEPLLSYLCDMTADEVIRVLSYYHQWIQQFGFTQHNGRWIYSLLVALEKPLPSEVYSILRDLSRVCSECRHKRDPKLDSKTLIALNLIICLIGRYFDQNDMCDE